MYKIRFVAGFTLLEMLITISIAAILLSVAVPGFSNFIRSSRAEVQPAALVNSLAFAKAEAVKRGQSISVKATSGNEWHKGWGIWLDSNNELLKEETAFSGEASLSTSDGTSEIVYGRQGNLVLDTAEMDSGEKIKFEYRFKDESGSEIHCRLGRDISVNRLGRVTVEKSGCE